MLLDGVEPRRGPCSSREETSWEGASAHLSETEGTSAILLATCNMGNRGVPRRMSTCTRSNLVMGEKDVEPSSDTHRVEAKRFAPVSRWRRCGWSGTELRADNRRLVLSGSVEKRSSAYRKREAGRVFDALQQPRALSRSKPELRS